MTRAILTTVLLLCTPLVYAKLIPVETLFRDPINTHVRMSPDGDKLALLVPDKGKMQILVIDREKGNKPLHIKADEEDVSSIRWATNNRILYRTDQVDDIQYKRTGGLYAVDADGKNPKALIKTRDDTRVLILSDSKIYSSEYIGPHPEKDDHILIARNDRNPRYPDVYAVDVNSGNDYRFMLNPGKIRRFAMDMDDEIRFGYETNFVDSRTVWFLNPETEEWETFVSDTGNYWSSLDFSKDRDTFLVETNIGRDKTAIFRYNWKSKEREEDPVVEDDTYNVDVFTRFTAPDLTNKLIGFYYEADKPRSRFFFKQFKTLQDLIDQELPGRFNQMLEIDDAHSQILLRSFSDRHFPSYYILSLDNMKLERVSMTTPWLDPSEMRKTRPIQYEASDGVTIHGYLTLPKQYQEGDPVPLIVNPHGGPWARDKWGMRSHYDLEVQFFANRGFAVLQPNYRGSTGHGQFFLDMANGQQIHRMHQDIIDGVHWAIDEGYAHPDQVGIAGASWGGFETMLGLTKNPDLFKFGINLMGVVDLFELIEWEKNLKRHETHHKLTKLVGDPKNPEDRPYIREWSPINFVENIESPLFVYHGVRDANVEIKQTYMLLSALKKHDIPHTKKIDTKELHSIEQEHVRIDTYKMIDKFLKPFREKWIKN